MTRVLHVMASGERGGGAEHLLALLPGLRELGFGCEAAVGAYGPLAGRLRDEGFWVDTVDLFRSRGDPRAPVRIARLIMASRPELVHFHGTRAAFFGALAHRIASWRVQSLYTVHGLAYRQERGAGGRAAFLAAELIACRGADRVISVSRTDLADLEKRRFVRPGAGTYVPNSVNTERFRPGDRSQARARLGLRPDAFVVGTVSRLVPQKSVRDLIEAMGLFPRGTLVIVGDGPEREQLEERSRRLGDRVQFLGARDDVADVLQAFDVFALSSRWEGEPIALLEAMSCGLPVIATATEGAREVLSGTRAGVLVEIGAPIRLAKAMEEIASSPFQREEMGKAARRAMALRSAAMMARRVAGVYAEMIEGAHRG